MRLNRCWRVIGMLSVGACLALGAGHGIAAADVESSDAGSGTAASQSAEPAGNSAGSTKTVAEQDDSAKPGKKRPKSKASASTVTVKSDETTAEATEPTEPAANRDDGAVHSKASPKHVEAATAEAARPATRPHLALVRRVAGKPVESENDGPATPAIGSEPAKMTAVAAVVPSSADVVPDVAPASAAPSMTAPPARPKLINVVGTLLFTVFTLPLKLLQHPTVIPPGYSVTIGKSTLDIGCGCGTNANTRWYFPDPDAHDGAAPQSIVYLEHGFLRSNSAMSAMAIELAQRTNSVVVTPTITSNPFATGGCWINGQPMQSAVADLFVGDRDALTASALAAGWTGGALPTKFVLAGHSAGGGLAAAAAGYTVDNGSAADLLLVVMLDGVPTGDAFPTALAKLTGADARQVLLMSSPPYAWNAFGLAAKQLVAARPGQFVGVQLVGGSHVDYEGASTDFLEELACGFSKPQNVKLAQDLAVEWINDAIAGTPVVAPGALGQTVTIPTSAGNAEALVLGGDAATVEAGRKLAAQRV